MKNFYHYLKIPLKTCLYHHFWTTPYDAEEIYPAGDYPASNQKNEGLPNLNTAKQKHRKHRLGMLVCSEYDPHCKTGRMAYHESAHHLY